MNHNTSSIAVTWLHPPFAWSKVNFDGAILSASGPGGAGLVASFEKGSLTGTLKGFNFAEPWSLVLN